MSDFKNVMKSGWHPKGKDGGKESWRGDFKGINQVAGWMGKGKKPGEGQASEHVSRPLASLKDPSSFGPPPKNVNYHGGAALPDQITPHTGGLGAPLSPAQIQSTNKPTQAPFHEEVQEQQKRQGPPVPYRADRTGLQTSHLPPPPVHRDLTSPKPEDVASVAKPSPSLPPRLPTRQNSAVVTSVASSTTPAPDAVASHSPGAVTNGGLNTAAINRLGKAGVSVPALGIGRNNASATENANPWSNEQSQTTNSSQPTSAASNTFSELSTRFARMNSNSATPAAPATQQPQSAAAQPASPPSWQQSQSALKTASSFHKDPSSVSVADAHNAAQTAGSAARSANAFREKHADSIAAAGRRANAFDQKYKVKSRFESFLDKHAPLDEPQQQPQQLTHQGMPVAQPQPNPSYSMTMQPGTSPELTASLSRKPPPPPPPKKPTGLHGNGNNASAPPVPINTKPTF